MSTLDQVLSLRLESSQAALKKFGKIQDIEVGGRIYDLLQLHGASRTGRWAGRGLQLQNLKRPGVKFPEAIAELIADGPIETFSRIGYRLENIGDCVRSAIAAPKGRRIVAADLASIESRVLGWIADCEALNSVFADDRDPYKDFATHWLDKPYDEISKAERNLSKPPSLGCGYGLGAKGLRKYAASMGVDLGKEDAKSAVEAYRTAYSEVRDLWYAVESAFIGAVLSRQPYSLMGGRLVFQKEYEFLTIRLPSGRKLYYKDPELENTLHLMCKNRFDEDGDLDPVRYEVKLVPGGIRLTAPEEKSVRLSIPGMNSFADVLHHFEEDVTFQSGQESIVLGSPRKGQSISYMGQNQFTNKWERIRTYGARLVENIVQAIARDILARSLQTATDWGLQVVGHVHDEILCEDLVEKAEDVLRLLILALIERLSWAPDLILGAEGYISKRMKKG